MKNKKKIMLLLILPLLFIINIPKVNADSSCPEESSDYANSDTYCCYYINDHKGDFTKFHIAFLHTHLEKSGAYYQFYHNFPAGDRGAWVINSSWYVFNYYVKPAYHHYTQGDFAYSVFWGNDWDATNYYKKHGYGECPQYAVALETKKDKDSFSGWGDDVWVFRNENEMNNFYAELETRNYKMLSNWPYAWNVSQEEYGAAKYKIDEEIISQDVDVNCDSLIDPETKDLINKILTYIGIIIPIIIIGFSAYEFAKAVASGEDQMKKAQKSFVRRIFVGLAFFLMPIIINVVFSFVEDLWKDRGLSSCTVNGEVIGVPSSSSEKTSKVTSSTTLEEK